MLQKYFHKVKFLLSADHFTQALLAMLVTNITSDFLVYQHWPVIKYTKIQIRPYLEYQNSPNIKYTQIHTNTNTPLSKISTLGQCQIHTSTRSSLNTQTHVCKTNNGPVLKSPKLEIQTVIRFCQ